MIYLRRGTSLWTPPQSSHFYLPTKQIKTDTQIIETNRHPRNPTHTHIWTINLQQRNQEHTQWKWQSSLINGVGNTRQSHEKKMKLGHHVRNYQWMSAIICAVPYRSIYFSPSPGCIQSEGTSLEKCLSSNPLWLILDRVQRLSLMPNMRKSKQSLKKTFLERFSWSCRGFATKTENPILNSIF